jgi:hypothetical protein
MPDRQTRLVGIPRRFTPEQERRRLERQIKALETLRTRGWWRAVAIEVIVIAAATAAAFALLAYVRALEGMPFARAGVALGIGLLIGMTLRRPWQTARFVVCGLFILVVVFVLAAMFESGEVPVIDAPSEGAGSKQDEKAKDKRRLDDAIARRQRRLKELGQ